MFTSDSSGGEKSLDGVPIDQAALEDVEQAVREAHAGREYDPVPLSRINAAVAVSLNGIRLSGRDKLIEDIRKIAPEAGSGLDLLLMEHFPIHMARTFEQFMAKLDRQINNLNEAISAVETIDAELKARRDALTESRETLRKTSCELIESNKRLTGHE